MNTKNTSATRILFSITIILCTVNLHSQEMVKSHEGELGKTISYNVSSFTDVRDKTIEDIIAKMPGITLDKNFGISFSYNGMRVNIIYIDGVDMLEGDYELILNMKPEDVERIEIVENHEPVKIMRGVQYSQDAAINIVLKDSAKSKWSGTAKLGMGATPMLYNGDVYALNTGGKMQSLVLFKTDNTGLNLGNGSNAFDGFYEYGMFDYLDVEPSMAPLDDKRTRFNNSTLFNITNTLKLSKDYQLNMQLSYLADKLTAESHEDKTYYLNDGGSLVDLKGETAESHKREISTNITLLANTEKMYLKNNLNFVIRWRDVEKSITGTYPNLQQVDMKPFIIKDDFIYNKAHNKNVFSINWSNVLLSKPQNLYVAKEHDGFVQDIDSKVFFSDAQAAYKLSLDKLTLTMLAGGTINMRKLDTNGTYISEAGTADNDSQLAYLKGYVNPSATYISDKLQVQLEMPLNFYRYRFTDRINDANDSSKNRTLFSPSFSLKYEASRRLSLTFEARADKSGIDKDRFFSGTIMRNFRNIKRGSLLYAEDGRNNIRGAFAYTVSEKSLFISGDITKEWNKSAFLDIMDFTSDYIISDYLLNPHTHDDNRLFINGSISKGIEAFKGKIGLDINYSSGSSSMVRNQTLMPFTSKDLTLTPNINGRLSSWLNTIYTISFRTSSMKLKDSNEDTSKMKEYTQSLEMIFSPTSRFNFSLSGEHYYTELSENLSKNLILTDFKTEYTISDKWQLIGTVTNILNQDTYNYTLVDSREFTRTHASYRIRPRNILLSLYYKF